jgi:hypothetical protein
MRRGCAAEAWDGVVSVTAERVRRQSMCVPWLSATRKVGEQGLYLARVALDEGFAP